jgi:hypothetical protein
MNKTVPSLLTALLLLSALTTAAAQERPRADEILRWFPFGYYSEITHRDDSLLRTGEAWPLFKEFLDRPDPFSGESALPPSLKEGIESTTVAQLLRLNQHEIKAADLKDLGSTEKKSTEKKSEEGAKEEPRPALNELPEGTSLTFMANVGDKLCVCRYDILDTRIEEALKKGEIADTGKRLDGRPVYQFRGEDDQEGYKGVYAYAAPEGELLTAGRLRNLALMVAAGTGREMNILDGEEYLDLIGMVPDLGQKWHAFCSRAMNKSMIEQMRKDGDDEERIAKLEESFAHLSSLHLETVDVGKQITERQIEVYPDEETAREMMNATMQTMAIGQVPDAITQHQRNLDAARMREQVDNLIITTVIYDRKLLESAKASNDALQKMIDQATKDGAGKGQTIIVVNTQDKKKKVKSFRLVPSKEVAIHVSFRSIYDVFLGAY